MKASATALYQPYAVLLVMSPADAQVRDRTATVSFSLEDAAAMKTVEPEWSQRQHEDRQVTRH